MEAYLIKVFGAEIGGIIARILPLILIFLIGVTVIKLILKLSGKMIKKSKIPKNAHSITQSFLKILLYFILVVMICSKLGVDVTSIVATFSIVGVALSLSLQSSLANVMSGITLLFTKQFNVDDFIEAGGISGTVSSIGLSHCKLITPDNKDIYVPNSTIISEKIINYSSERKRRVDVIIGVAYGEDIDKVKATLKTVVDDTPQILKDEPVFVGIVEYKDSCVNYTIRAWVKSNEYWDAYLPMLEKVKRALDDNKIEIPYNKLDVHVINK